MWLKGWMSAPAPRPDDRDLEPVEPRRSDEPAPAPAPAL
jgi:hypothetical protein